MDGRTDRTNEVYWLSQWEQKPSFLIGKPPHSSPSSLRSRLPPNLIDRPLQSRLDRPLLKTLDIKVCRRNILIVQVSRKSRGPT